MVTRYSYINNTFQTHRKPMKFFLRILINTRAATILSYISLHPNNKKQKSRFRENNNYVNNLLKTSHRYAHSLQRYLGCPTHGYFWMICNSTETRVILHTTLKNLVSSHEIIIKLQKKFNISRYVVNDTNQYITDHHCVISKVS